MYMQSTTIRVSAQTRDSLNELCRSSGRTADSVVAELVEQAKQAALLDAAEAHWHAVAVDGTLLSLYKGEAAELEVFDSNLPDY